MNTRTFTNSIGTLAIAAFAVFILATATSFAAIRTWSPGSGTWQDGTAGNFDGNWTNSNPDSAVFTGSANTTYTVTVNGAIDIQDLSFTTSGASQNNTSKYIIDGGTLNFASGGIISTNRNDVDQTITSTITGSPAVNIKDYNPGGNNQYEGIAFAPGTGMTQTLGVITMPDNTGTGDKAGVTLGGSTTGNSVTSIAYAGGDRYGTVYKTGPGTWTTGDITTGIVRVYDGTLIVNGTVTTDYQGLNMYGGKVSGDATFFKNDRRAANDFVSGTGISPGNSIGVITFDWGTSGGPTSSQWTTAFRAGSQYDWEVGTGNTTDIVNIVDGRLILEGFTLNIMDAGGMPTAIDELPVFTYGTLDNKTLDLGSVVFDNSGAPDWDISGVSLFDDGDGTISLTGLVGIPEPSSIILAGLGLMGLCFRRGRK